MALKAVNEILGQYEISTGFKHQELKQLAGNPKTASIQFDLPLTEREIEALEESVFSRRPDIALRVYGYYGKVCDLSFLKKLPSLRKFSADCLREAKGIEWVTEIKNLEVLGVGIYDLENFDFLNGINPDLKKLYLHQTRSKKTSLNTISRFVQLEELYLEAQSKGIEAIHSLKMLRDITLRSISTPNLNYLNDLKHLWSVDVKLGGIKDFSALKTLPNLKYLELWQVRQLFDISFITDLTSLQNLFIQSLSNVEEIPSIDKLHKLKRFELENMKGLKRMDALRTAPALEEFTFLMAQQEPESLLPLLENKKVKSVLCRFGSEKKNNRFKELADAFGKSQYKYHKFIYQ